MCLETTSRISYFAEDPPAQINTESRHKATEMKSRRDLVSD